MLQRMSSSVEPSFGQDTTLSVPTASCLSAFFFAMVLTSDNPLMLCKAGVVVLLETGGKQEALLLETGGKQAYNIWLLFLLSFS